MTTAIQLSVKDALIFAKTSTDPISIIDSPVNIVANADALVKLGTRLVAIKVVVDFITGTINYPISIVNFLALAPKTTDYFGSAAIFTQVAGSVQDFIYNEPVLATSRDFGGYLLPDGTNFKVTFASKGHAVTTISANVSNVLSHTVSLSSLSTTLNAPLYVNDTATNIAANADALVQLGSLLTGIYSSYVINETNISLTDFLALAPKTTNGFGVATIFYKVTGNLYDFANNITAIAKLGGQLGNHNYTLLDGTNFNVTFSSDGHSVASVTINSATSPSINLISSTLAAPITIRDTAVNIIANADTLVKLGAKLIGIQIIDVYNATVDYPISLSNFLSLAAKTTDYFGSAAIFTQVTGSVQDFIHNELALETTGKHFGGYLLPDGSHFKVTFDSNSHSVTAISVNVSNALSHTVSLSSLSTTLNAALYVNDTADNVAANADALVQLGSQLTGIKLVNNYDKTISLTDFLVLAAKTTDDQNHLQVFQVTGTLQDFVNNEATLATLSSQLGSYTLPDGTYFQVTFSTQNHSVTTITMDASNASSSSASLISTALGKPTIHVSDKLINIIVHADALVKLGAQLASINVEDFLPWWVSQTISLTDFLALAAKTNDFNNHHHIFQGVTGSLQDFVTNEATLAALSSQLAGYTLPDGTYFQVTFSTQNHSVTTISMDAKNASSPSASLISTTLGKPIDVSDDLINVAVHADALAKLGAQLATIHIDNATGFYDRPISLTDFLVLASKITHVHNHSVIFTNVTGSLQDFFNNESALGALAQQLGTYTLPDGTHFKTIFNSDHSIQSITMDAQNASLSGDLMAISNQGILINVNDFAGSIKSYMDYLQANINYINSLHFNDLSPQTISLSSQQILNYSHVLDKLTSPYQLALTSVKANVLSYVLTNSHVLLPVHLVDGALKIFSVLDTVQAHLQQISAISIISKVNNPRVIISADQYHNDALALAKINADGNLYTLSLTAENVTQLPNDLIDTHVKQVSLTDTSSQLISHLDELQAVNNRLGKITFTDSTSPTITLSAQQYWADHTVFSKITSGYQLVLSNETASYAIKDAINSHLSAITISDSAWHVLNHWSELSSMQQITQITLTDTTIPTITLSALQISSGIKLLNTIDSSYHLVAKDTVSALNQLDLNTVQSSESIEIMPTQLDGNLTIDHYITQLNLSLLSLVNNTVIEKNYGTNGTEIDILTKDVLTEQMIFTHDNEAQLHLTGIPSTQIHFV